MENIQVILLRNISDKIGKVMDMSELDNNCRYHFQIRSEGDRIIFYPFFRALSKDISEEILCLKAVGISGDYFVAPIKRRKIKWRL